MANIDQQNLNTQIRTVDQSIVFNQVIDQRYSQALEQFLQKNEINFSQITQTHSYLNQSKKVYQIQSPQSAVRITKQHYFNLLKNLFELETIRTQNPSFKFQSFLTQYKSQLVQKLQKFNTFDTLTSKTQTNNLNSLTANYQLQIVKQQTLNLIKNNRQQLKNLQEEQRIINKDFYKVIQTVVKQNSQANIQNLQIQLKIKAQELKQKQKFSKSFLPNNKKKQYKQNSQNLKQKQNNNKLNDKQQELQRIKVVIKNNMWGWGDKISQRLNKFKSLRAQIQQSSSNN